MLDENMTAETFDTFKPILELKLKELHLKSFELMYESGFDETPRIHILVEEEDVDLVDRWCYLNKKGKGWLDKMKESYGYFSIVPRKIIRNDVTDVKLGDFVIIDSDWEYNQNKLGIVLSVQNENGKNIYGCGYVMAAFTDKYSEEGLRVSAEDYGGYHEGFKAVISKAQAKKILKQKPQKENRIFIFVLPKKTIGKVKRGIFIFRKREMKTLF